MSSENPTLQENLVTLLTATKNYVDTQISEASSNQGVNILFQDDEPTDTNALWVDTDDESTGTIPISAVSGLQTALDSKGNKVTSIDEDSTDSEYPSAKCVYDLIGDVSTAISSINEIIGGQGGGIPSGGGINYSTQEQDTGIKWIDGKTIYQRTINFVFNQSEGTHDLISKNEIADLDVIVEYQGIMISTDGRKLCRTFPHSAYDTNAIRVYDTQDTIHYVNYSNWSTPYTVYLTIKYTKTTTQGADV